MKSQASSSNIQTNVSLYDVDNLLPHHCGYCDTNGSVSVGNFHRIFFKKSKFKFFKRNVS